MPQCIFLIAGRALGNGVIKSPRLPQQAKRAENSPGPISVLISTPSAVGIGLDNLKFASVIVMIGECATLAEDEQALGRVVRHGQPHVVLHYRLGYESSFSLANTIRSHTPPRLLSCLLESMDPERLSYHLRSSLIKCSPLCSTTCTTTVYVIEMSSRVTLFSEECPTEAATLSLQTLALLPCQSSPRLRKHQDEHQFVERGL